MADITEHYSPFSKTRHDLFGIFDAIAVKGMVTLGIQCTSGMNNKSARLQKIRASDEARIWLSAGNHIELWVWRQLKPRGTKRELWKVQRNTIGLNDLVGGDDDGTETAERKSAPAGAEDQDRVD